MSEKNWKCNKENTLTAFAFHCFSTVQRVPAEDIFEDLDDRCKQRSSQIQFFDYLLDHVDTSGLAPDESSSKQIRTRTRASCAHTLLVVASNFLHPSEALI